MRRKAIIAVLAVIIVIVSVVAVCALSVSLEDEAKVQAIDFAQQYIKFDIHHHNHDLQVITDDKIHYTVTGIIKKQTDLTHLYMVAILELRKTEKLWILDTLIIDNITLYP